MLAQIIDSVTKELSKAINMIWSEKTLEANLEKLKNNATERGVKECIDTAQSMLLELLTYLEQFEIKLAFGFYMLDNE